MARAQGDRHRTGPETWSPAKKKYKNKEKEVFKAYTKEKTQAQEIISSLLFYVTVIYIYIYILVCDQREVWCSRFTQPDSKHTL